MQLRELTGDNSYVMGTEVLPGTSIPIKPLDEVLPPPVSHAPRWITSALGLALGAAVGALCGDRRQRNSLIGAVIGAVVGLALYQVAKKKIDGWVDRLTGKSKRDEFVLSSNEEPQIPATLVAGMGAASEEKDTAAALRPTLEEEAAVLEPEPIAEMGAEIPVVAESAVTAVAE